MDLAYLVMRVPKKTDNPKQPTHRFVIVKNGNISSVRSPSERDVPIRRNPHRQGRYLTVSGLIGKLAKLNTPLGSSGSGKRDHPARLPEISQPGQMPFSRETHDASSSQKPC